MTIVFYTLTHTHFYIFTTMYILRKDIPDMAEIDREGFIEIHSELNHAQY